MEYEKRLKNSGPSTESKPQVAQAAQPLPDPEPHPSYWESAFSAMVESDVPTIGDTGATSHMFSSKNHVSNIQTIRPTRIGVASKDGAIWATEKGKVRFGSLTLKHVLISPKLMGNLISIGRLCDDGHRASSTKNRGVILGQQGDIVLKF